MREYIGARYMPKFMGTYDATTAYEALSVVDNGMGTSYISNKPVPAGTPLTDSTYWVIYGASSGAILDLQERMADVENVIQYEHTLRNRKFVLIGDSYALTYDDVVGWKDQFVTKLGLSSTDYYAACENGHGFYAGFESLLDTLPNDDNVTDVLIIGGTNDIQYASANKATLISRIQSCVAKANTKYPYAKVHVGWCSSVFKDSTVVLNDLPICRQVIEDTAAGAGCAIIPHLDDILCDMSRHKNLDHPNTLGCAIIVGQLVAYLLGGTLSGFIPEKAITWDFTDASAGCSSCSDIYYKVCGDEIHLRGVADSTARMSKFVVNSANVRSRILNGTDSISVALMTNFPLCYYSHRLAWLPAVFHTTSNTLIQGAAAIYMYSGYMTIAPFAYDSGAAVTATVDEVYMNINLVIPRI